MKHVFISYASEDRATADLIRQGLEAASYATWVYEGDNVTALSYVGQVVEALGQASAVVVILSNHSLESKDVDSEISEAYERRLPLVPVLVTPLSYEDFKRETPTWKFMFRSNVAATISDNDVAAVMPGLVAGLRKLGIEPSATTTEARMPGPPVRQPRIVETTVLEPPAAIVSPPDKPVHAPVRVGQSGTLPPGYVLDEYRIERVLGQGGFGITYLALDTQLRQPVAIKEYFPRDLAIRMAGNSTVAAVSTTEGPLFQKYLEGFLAEAQTLAQLRHHAIVRVRRYIRQLGTAYMVMDYEDGPSLHEVLAGMASPPDDPFLTRLTGPLLDALAAVHEKQILHRDIKPRNIVIRSDGSPVLLDFGAARSFAAMSAGATAIFSFGYAPPEQVEGGVDQGPWTDVYGMAAVLYHVIGLKPPVHSINRRDLGVQIASAVDVGRGRYDPMLLRAIDWGLRLPPRERPQSIAEWRNGRDGEAGMNARAPQPPGAEPAPSPDTVTQPSPVLGSPRPARARRLSAVAGLAVAALLALAFVGKLPPKHDVTVAEPTPVSGPPAVSASAAPPVTTLPDRPRVEGDIAALGMVDGTLERYASNPDVLLADLRADARRQVLEKAVGIFVVRDALDEQYDDLRNTLFAHTELIDELSDDAKPRRSDAGLVYLPAKANVRIQDLRRLIFQKSREQRIALIRSHGDPLISVSVSIRDAERGSPIERSALAENVIKKTIRDFGYRVATPPAAGAAPGGPSAPDFAIESEAKLKRLQYTLQASGLTIQKYVLTSWTVKCTERSTGEDIYFDNQLPRQQSWADEDQALAEIGTLIADQFSQDFFAQHLPRSSRYSKLAIMDVAPDASQLIARELMGLRSVVGVDPQGTTGGAAVFGVSWYDQGPGGEQSFDGTVLAPLRRKLGTACLDLTSDAGAQQVVVRLSKGCEQDLVKRLEQLPTAALCEAPAQRLEMVARSPALMEKLFAINPQGVTALANRGVPEAVDALRRARESKVDL